ncbi:sulfatase-like hydrolase/transferase [Verrucomicrobiaceae bacterium E54]|nr:sulfatase-like hydrolase/transferase [Verrucomicrobiaceae bacterium E54]
MIIVSDDQGYGDLGCYGSGEAETPNLDRMAKEGVRLTDFYVTHPACTPSRAGLLTGRYAQRCTANWALINRNHPAFNDEKEYTGGIPASEDFLLPAVLKEVGYRTGCFGKWHLGHGQGQKPFDRGFDDSLISAMGYVDCFTGRFFGHPDIFKNGVVQDFSGYTNDAYVDAAIKFVEASKDHPFFIYLPFNAVHSSPPTEERPYPMVQAPAEDLNHFKAKGFSGHRLHYLAALHRMDQGIGRLETALEKNGVAQNTLVIFFSDNGGHHKFGAENSPLRGQKATLLEGGIRVPAIVKWPGVLPPGELCEEPLMQLDFFNMSLAAAKASVPSSRRLDGKNPTPTLKGEAASPHDRLVFQFHQSVAVREGRYKLFRPHGAHAGYELYDLEKDVGETENLAVEHPDVVQRLAADPLLEELEALFEATPRE